MEPKFQNTFIPKRPVVTERKNVATPRRKTSFFGILVTLVFIATLIATGGVFGYTKYLQVDIEKKDIKLKEQGDALDRGLIQELALADAQLDLAEGVFGKHLAPSRFFERLEEITLQPVQFTSFSYEASPGKNPSITLSGLAPDYNVAALQSDLFARDEFIESSIFSDLNETEDGDVIFNVEASAKSKLTSYKN